MSLSDKLPSAPRFLVVEGPIGVGKTSLVKRLANTFNSEILLEEAEENPFLQGFYRDRRAAAFPTQLFFLFQRSRQLSGLQQHDMFMQSMIADFMLDKDRLFAELNLDDNELQLYNQVYQTLQLQAPRPDLVVYLQAPVEVLQNRVQKRNRANERSMDAGYLKRLLDAYNGYFSRYDASPLLIINAAEINPLESDADYQLLVEKICTIKAGRHFFNPGPSLL
ncbi:MAG: deoxynucleoside kinase [Chromatiales bacterium]|jgi:deoxyadenosine/deoxycytidine kinase